MRKPRPAARLLIVDEKDRVLLFRFDAEDKPTFWATPGGACDPGESYAEAARREMWEETGFQLNPGPEVAKRTAVFTTIEDEDVESDERYFLIRVPVGPIDTSGHTELERRVMTVHRWWQLDELRASDEIIFPNDIADMIVKLSQEAE